MSRTKFLVAVKFPGNPVKNILPRPQCIGTADRGPICFYQERKIYFRFRYIIRGANTAVFSKPSVFGRTRRHRALICDSVFQLSFLSLSLSLSLSLYLSIYLSFFSSSPTRKHSSPTHFHSDRDRARASSGTSSAKARFKLDGSQPKKNVKGSSRTRSFSSYPSRAKRRERGNKSEISAEEIVFSPTIRQRHNVPARGYLHDPAAFAEIVYVGRA